MTENLVRLFNSAKSLLIVVSKTAKIDGVAAALALNLAAIQQGKNVKVCSEVELAEANKLVGADKISNKFDLGGTTLMASFPYTDGSIDKVTYNITDDKFNLLVEPAPGMPPLEAKNVKFAYTGANVDLIICIDTPNLEALGDIYLGNPDFFVKEKIINIDRRFDNKQYGAENIVEKKFSSTSELILKLLESIRWDINPDIVTNLYAGLMTATNNFTSFSTNAQSFEVASFLLKNGARKIPINMKQVGQSSKGFGAFGKQMPTLGGLSTPFGNQAHSTAGQGFFNRPQVESLTEDSSSSQKVFNQQDNQPQPDQDKSKSFEKPIKQEKKQPPQDWLKPKIFKSTDLI